jgi:Matrixin
VKVNPALAGLAIVGLTFGVAFGAGPVIERLTEDTEGDYSFLATQPDDPSAPVTWPSCRVIEVAIEPDGAPEDNRELVDTALSHVSRWSGLAFRVVDGPKAQILVKWTDAEEVPGLAGDVVGLGGSTPVERGGVLVYDSGSVTLDREAFDDLRGWRGDRREAQAIMDHEFGHAIGLGHVQDVGELMNEENYGRKAFGPGDREGLALLGKGPCV